MNHTSVLAGLDENDEDELPEKHQYLGFLKEIEMYMSVLFLIVVRTL
jgi:hypothetical protein